MATVVFVVGPGGACVPAKTSKPNVRKAVKIAHKMFRERMTARFSSYPASLANDKGNTGKVYVGLDKTPRWSKW